MAKYISSEGSFRTDDFFNSGAGTKAGKIRSRYCEHLEVSETVLRDLISHVRFRLGENLTSLEERLWDKLRFACMHVPEAGKSNTIYCELAWRLLEQGKNILDAVKLTEIIKQEGLIERTNSEGSDIAIRSFPQTLRSATWRYSSVLDLMDLFDGRYVRDSTQWNTLILERIREFMLRVRSDELEPPTRFWFDCHLSICFLVGHLANPKSGWHIVPVQKSRISGYHLWTEPNSQESGLWKRRHQRGDQSEMILGISVSNRVDVQVEHFIAGEPMSRFERHFFEPLSGPGAKSVKDGADAWQLGYELRSILESVTSVSCHRIHLFMACPAALAFILGNCLRGIVSQFQLYEFDFEAKRTGPRYEPSFRIRSSELI